MNQWSNYSQLRAWCAPLRFFTGHGPQSQPPLPPVRRDDIATSIEDADQTLNAYLHKFHVRVIPALRDTIDWGLIRCIISQIKAQFSTHERFYEAEENRRRDQDEMRAALDKLLTSNDHLFRQINEMRSTGEPVAEDVMGAAQAVCNLHASSSCMASPGLQELHAQPRDSPRYHQYENIVY